MGEEGSVGCCGGRMGCGCVGHGYGGGKKEEEAAAVEGKRESQLLDGEGVGVGHCHGGDHYRLAGDDNRALARWLLGTRRVDV